MNITHNCEIATNTKHYLTAMLTLPAVGVTWSTSVSADPGGPPVRGSCYRHVRKRDNDVIVKIIPVDCHSFFTEESCSASGLCQWGYDGNTGVCYFNDGPQVTG